MPLFHLQDELPRIEEVVEQWISEYESERDGLSTPQKRETMEKYMELMSRDEDLDLSDETDTPEIDTA